jgi:myo-inositol-1(or 4)-monophosphatase
VKNALRNTNLFTQHEFLTRRDAAIRVAREAGAFAKSRFLNRSALTIEAKGAQDWVSEADRDTETLIRARLAEAFPADGFLGEEHGGAQSGPMWVVDPIDGTINFVHGVRYWCISIAFWDGEKPVVGVVYDPMADECFSGALGAGAHCNDVPMSVSSCNKLATAMLCHGYVSRHSRARNFAERNALYDAGAALKDMGAGALMLAHVAAGRYDGYSEAHMHPWDALAGLLLVKEAGGTQLRYPTDVSNMHAGGEVITASPKLYDALVGTLRSVKV